MSEQTQFLNVVDRDEAERRFRRAIDLRPLDSQTVTLDEALGRVLAADVVNLTEATTLQGGKVAIDTSNGVMVDNARVIATDIETSNGVIHVIDTVILPGS